MKLRFTFRGEIPEKYQISFNRIAENICDSFTELVESLSKRNVNNFDWWVTGLASRNTISNPLFFYCCCLAFLKELIRTNVKISELEVDSRALQKIIQKLLGERGIKAKVKVARRSIKQFLLPAYAICYVPLKYLFLYLITKVENTNKKPSIPIILIDTFIVPGYINKDRYYTGIHEVLDEKELDQIYFTPSPVGFPIWRYKEKIEKFCKSHKNFILKEEYLKIWDYMFAFAHIFRIHKLKIDACEFLDMDISGLIKEEVRGFREFESSFVALLNYCFAKRLKNVGVELKLVIDWFENQIVDRGWNAGFQKFYSETTIKGYQGFAAFPNYLCMYPTETERQGKVIPNQISVIGQGLVNSLKRYCPDLNVSIAPAFRFNKVWDKRTCYPDKKYFTLLAALPIMQRDGAHILDLLYSADIQDERIRVWIKPHPAISSKYVEQFIKNKSAGKFEIINGDFNDLVEKADLLISTTSNTCLETLARGIPVVVVGNRKGLLQNPIPKNIDASIYRICLNSIEIKDAVKYFIKNRFKNYDSIREKIRADYFEPVTYKGVRQFLQLS